MTSSRSIACFAPGRCLWLYDGCNRAERGDRPT
jgi:hypothetical protein